MSDIDFDFVMPEPVRPLDWQWRNPMQDTINRYDIPFFPCQVPMCGAYCYLDWASVFEWMTLGGLVAADSETPEGIYRRVFFRSFWPCDRCELHTTVTFDYATKDDWNKSMWEAGFQAYDAFRSMYAAWSAFANGAVREE